MSRLETVSVHELKRRGRRLEYFTLGWDGLEAGVAIFAGLVAGSTALLGFGLDSLIEGTSGVILLWRLAAGEHREQIALRLVGTSLLLLALYVLVESIESLLVGAAPGASYVGMALAASSLVVMPILAQRKRRLAAALNSKALHADSHQTDICAYLSALLLIGLGLNALWGWWWADPVAALLMVPLIGNEGMEALRGEKC